MAPYGGPKVLATPATTADCNTSLFEKVLFLTEWNVYVSMILWAMIVARWTKGPSLPIEKSPANTKGSPSILPHR